MAAGASTAERLRQFLRELAPAARAMLLRELERGSFSGESFPGLDLILGELRELERGSETSAAVPRIEGLDRRLFQPLTPFLVDEGSSEKMRGRIARSSLGYIWTWVERDLMVDEIRAQVDQLSRTLAQVPYRTPVLGEIELSSGFGVRTDPFLGRPAMHTGVDFP